MRQLQVAWAIVFLCSFYGSLTHQPFVFIQNGSFFYVLIMIVSLVLAISPEPLSSLRKIQRQS